MVLPLMSFIGLSRAWQIFKLELGTNRCSNRIFAKLPRELRDKIYTELAIAATTGFASDKLNMRYQRALDIGGNRVVEPIGLAGLQPLHYFDDDYMGSTFVNEYIRTLYELVHVSIAHVNDIPSCLGKDCFKTNAVPSQHIRKLTVVLSLHTINAETGRPRPRLNEATASSHLYASAVGKLQPLKTLSYKSAVIDIVVKGDNVGTAQKFELALADFMYDMTDLGYKIFTRHAASKYGTVFDFRLHLSREELNSLLQNNVATVSTPFWRNSTMLTPSAGLNAATLMSALSYTEGDTMDRTRSAVKIGYTELGMHGRNMQPIYDRVG
jgi:hypothetical protein